LTRIIYLAVGDFPEERPAVARDLFGRYHAALESGATPEAAEQVFPASGRASAERAAVAIREFEAAVGVRCGAPPSVVYRPQRQPWWPRSPPRPTYTVPSFAVGLMGHFSGSRELQAAAEAAATALCQLLVDLGATDAFSSTID